MLRTDREERSGAWACTAWQTPWQRMDRGATETRGRSRESTRPIRRTSSPDTGGVRLAGSRLGVLRARPSVDR
jgi:hypothetical protein